MIIETLLDYDESAFYYRNQSIIPFTVRQIRVSLLNDNAHTPNVRYSAEYLGDDRMIDEKDVAKTSDELKSKIANRILNANVPGE